MLWAMWDHFQGGSLCLTSSVCCFLGSLVQSRCGEGRYYNQIALSCAHSISAPLDLSFLVVHTMLSWEPSGAGPRLRALPWSKPLRFGAQAALRGTNSAGTALCALPKSE